ncbi:MAG: diacylglycerol kinase family lipid kinase [Clostridia bacterium]|nr:diacylglycerol kinase family lipid kinase [Clostridia bacterium]
MERKPLLFLINPNAGRTDIRVSLLAVCDTLSRGGYDVIVRPTTRAGEIPDILQEWHGKVDTVVACGGDGTLNETVDAMMHLSPRPVLGYIPGGTVNDFASSLGIPKNPLAAAETIVNGTPFGCDIGRFGNRYFSYIAAFGAFTEVAYQTPQKPKSVLGRTAYILEGIKRLPTLRSYHLRIETPSACVEDDYIFGMISNSTSVGGFKLNGKHHVSMHDGLLELVLVKNPDNILALNDIINSIVTQNFNSEYVHFLRTSRVSVTSSDVVAWTLDGEFGGAPQSISIEACREALRVIV